MAHSVNLGRTAHEHGDINTALVCYDAALSLLEDDGDNDTAADVLRWKGLALSERGDTAPADRFLRRSLAMSERLQYTSGWAHSLNCLGIVAQRRGEMKEAERLHREAARLAAQSGDKRLLGMAEGNQGTIAAALGDWDAAIVWMRLSHKTLESVGDSRGASRMLSNMGLQYVQRRKYAMAVDCFEQALETAYDLGDIGLEAATQLNLAEVKILQGDFTYAARSVARVLTIAELRGDRLRLAEALRVRARIERNRGHLEEALETLRDARYQARESEDAILRIELLCDKARIHRECGDVDGSRAAFNTAIAGFNEIGAIHRAAAIVGELSVL